MNIFDMKKSDFLKVRHREWNEEIGAFDSLIIIPTRKKHDSGYMCMDFCAEKGGEPVALLSGCSDVLHIGGMLSSIRERGQDGWRVDCLPCGYLRLFNEGEIVCGRALSSFEVFSALRRLQI